LPTNLVPTYRVFPSPTPSLVPDDLFSCLLLFPFAHLGLTLVSWALFQSYCHQHPPPPPLLAFFYGFPLVCSNTHPFSTFSPLFQVPCEYHYPFALPLFCFPSPCIPGHFIFQFRRFFLISRTHFLPPRSKSLLVPPTHGAYCPHNNFSDQPVIPISRFSPHSPPTL